VLKLWNPKWRRGILPALLLTLAACGKDNPVRNAFSARSGTVDLPSSEVTITAPLRIENADGLTIRGNGARLKVDFNHDAAIVIRNSNNVRLENFTLIGNREAEDRRFGLPPSDQPMARWNKNNGILVEQSTGVTLEKLTVREVVSYPILVNNSRKVTVEQVLVGDSGSLDEKDMNNATGGILFEEGCEDFTVRLCKLRNIRGNGIWTHSLLSSPRNRKGIFEENDLRYIGRDALQAGHAIDLRISGNTGAFIGYPADNVDVLHLANPVAVDTAGNVENSLYAGNQFEEVNGKCIDLDGFHDGEVRGNECVNRRAVAAYPHGHFGIVLNNSNPQMESRNIRILGNRMEGFRFGGIFLIGEGHVVRDNQFRRINLAQCNENPNFGCLYKPDEPDLLQTGIYLGKGAERPAPSRNLTIENNIVQGHKMAARCIGVAPGVVKQASKISGNQCSD
jgi:hypothetical protein